MKVLYLTHRVPYAPNRGDRIRAYHVLRYLKARGVSVCLVALAHDDKEMAEAAGLHDLVDALRVVRVTRARNLVKAGLAIAGDQPLTHWLLDSPEMRPVLETARREWQPDVVLAFCSGMARFAMEPPLDTVPFVHDMVDVDSFKWETLAKQSWGPLAWVYRREADVLREFEVQATHEARATLVVSDRECRALRSLDPRFKPIVLPNGVDIDTFRNKGAPSAVPEVVFTGVFGYRPNEHGARWLIDHVWPRVRRSQPHAHLMLVGRGPSASLRNRARRAGVEVTGTVPDVRPYLWRAAIAVAPLETAHGVQNKVLEAVAAGLPVVATSAVYDGLPEAVRPACRVAPTAEMFAEAIAELLTASAETRRELASRADLKALTWEVSLKRLPDILRRATEVPS